MNSTKERIYQYIEKVGKSTPFEISEKFLIGRAMTHRHLKKLLEEGLLEKEGSPPRVFYSVKKSAEKSFDEKKYDKNIFTKEESDYLEKNFLYITATGKRISGKKAFLF